MSDIQSRNEERKMICVVDDDYGLRQAVATMLRSKGHLVLDFTSGSELTAWLEREGDSCALVISDVEMPGESGFEVCRRIRSRFSPERLPIILVTGLDSPDQKAHGLEVGADDFISKPFRSRELLAKVDSLLKIQRRQERLTQFVPRQVVELVASEDKSRSLVPHRAEITVLFADLRGFTRFSDKAPPEEILALLTRYYEAVGNAILRHRGAIGHLAGDGVMGFFNDPEPLPNHCEAAARAAMEAREELLSQRDSWQKLGYELDFGMGLAEGVASIGRIGFKQFSQFSVIGGVVNLAARLCQAAERGQVLVTQPFLSRVESTAFGSEPVARLLFKGFDAAVSVHQLVLEEARRQGKAA